jgi:hypothetical protein
MIASEVYEFWYDHLQKSYVFPRLPNDTQAELKASGLVVIENGPGGHFRVLAEGDALSKVVQVLNSSTTSTFNGRPDPAFPNA